MFFACYKDKLTGEADVSKIEKGFGVVIEGLFRIPSSNISLTHIGSFPISHSGWCSRSLLIFWNKGIETVFFFSSELY